jgi:hypothetical protein
LGPGAISSSRPTSATLCDAEHRRQLAGVANKDEPARQVGPIERHRKEEAQCRHRAIDALWLHAALGLIDLEATDILGCRRVRRPPEKLSEAPHEPDIIALRILLQAARRHVFEHPSAQRTHGLWNGLDGHLVFSLS